MCVIGALNFSARRHGPLEAFSIFDEALFKLINKEIFGGTVTPLAKQQLQLPIRMGGLGLRPTWPFAAAAHVGCVEQVLDIQPDLDPPSSLERAYGLLTATQLESPIRSQKALSKVLIEEQLSQWKRQLSMRHLAIVTSLEAPSANLYLTKPTVWAKKLFLSNEQLRQLLFFRLGLPLTQAPFSCPRCGHEADTFGDHVLRCMTGGEKSLLHSDLCRQLYSTCSSILLRPKKEEHPFADPALRCDVSILNATGSDSYLHMDLACTHVIQNNTRTMLRATTSAGGAATEYESIKRNKYNPYLQNIEFVPMIVDTMGAWGEAAKPVIQDLVKAWKQRFSTATDGVTPRLTGPVFQRTANTLLFSIPDHSDCTDSEDGMETTQKEQPLSES